MWVQSRADRNNACIMGLPALTWVTMNRQKRCLTACALACVWFATVGGQQDLPLRPKLMLVLSIDQMRVDYLSRFAALYRGGPEELAGTGRGVPQRPISACLQRKPVLVTPCCCRADIRVIRALSPTTGVIRISRNVNVVDRSIQIPFGGEGRSASPVNAFSFTVGDVLRSAEPRSRMS